MFIYLLLLNKIKIVFMYKYKGYGLSPEFSQDWRCSLSPFEREFVVVHLLGLMLISKLCYSFPKSLIC